MTPRPIAIAAAAYSRHNRSKKSRKIVDLMELGECRSVLLVGAQPNDDHGFSNVVERAVEAHADWTIASGFLHDAAVGRTTEGSSWESYVCADGRSLPFRDDAFDIVVSNAIVEHVGNEDEQIQFSAEQQRVAKYFVMTTPNRWFPIESHRRLPLIHWFPAWRRRQTAFTRLLSLREFEALLPSGTTVEGSFWSPTFLAHNILHEVR